MNVIKLSPLLLYLCINLCFSAEKDTIHYKKVWTNPNPDSSKLYWFARDFICSDSNTCAAFIDSLASNAKIIVTTDGGYTWNLINNFNNNNNSFTIRDAAFLNKDSIMVTVLSHGKIKNTLRTTNGGINWDTLSYVLNCEPIYLYYLSFLKNGHGMALAGYENIYNASTIVRTTDFGLTWTKVIDPYLPITYHCFMLTETDYCVHGVDFFSLDGSDTNALRQHLFARIKKDRDYYIYWYFYDGIEKACFIDSLEGWAVCSRLLHDNTQNGKEIIKHTTDGGNTWETQLDTLIQPYGMFLSSISFADKLTGGAIGLNGKLWLTKDGGITWTADSTFPFWGKSKETQNNIYIQYLTPKKFLVLLNWVGEIWMYNEDGFGETGIDEKPKESAISIKPNPAENYCEIEFELEQFGGYTISILDLQGNTLKKFTEDDCAGGKFTRTIDLSGLAAGQYFCRVEAGGKSHSEKFVITR